MSDELKPGDPVAWNTSQGETCGEVVRKQTRAIHIKGHKVSASPEDPQYVVRSGKCGETAAHRPDALKKRG